MVDQPITWGGGVTQEDLEYLKWLFDYRDGYAGWGLYRKRDHCTTKSGEFAGSNETTRNQTYRRISFLGRRYYAHVLIWFFVTGHFPQYPLEEVDHIDHDTLNNKFKNLRLVTRSMNDQNQVKAQRDNVCGFLGVSFDKKRNQFRASIRVKGKTLHLGRYQTGEDAHEAYLLAKRKHHAGNTL